MGHARTRSACYLKYECKVMLIAGFRGARYKWIASGIRNVGFCTLRLLKPGTWIFGIILRIPIPGKYSIRTPIGRSTPSGRAPPARRAGAGARRRMHPCSAHALRCVMAVMAVHGRLAAVARDPAHKRLVMWCLTFLLMSSLGARAVSAKTLHHFHVDPVGGSDDTTTATGDITRLFASINQAACHAAKLHQDPTRAVGLS